jgi:HSP20 family protein
VVIERFSPWAELRRFDELFNRALRSNLASTDAPEAWVIPVDVSQDGDSVIVRASLPGVDSSKIDVTVEEGVLSIKADTDEEKELRSGEYLLRERRTGSFYRAVRLPDSLDDAKAKSEFKNGVLTVTFPRQESKKARKLDVSAAK